MGQALCWGPKVRLSVRRVGRWAKLCVGAPRCVCPWSGWYFLGRWAKMHGGLQCTCTCKCRRLRTCFSRCSGAWGNTTCRPLLRTKGVVPAPQELLLKLVEDNYPLCANPDYQGEDAALIFAVDPLKPS